MINNRIDYLVNEIRGILWNGKIWFYYKVILIYLFFILYGFEC